MAETSGLWASFVGAVQASLAVLLTVYSGVLAAQFNLLSSASAKDISKTAVQLFLPALLITNVGSELHLETVHRYIPVLIWSILYNVLSMGIGMGLTKLFNFPGWVTPALAFNNTTSLPLLLVQSLNATGILSSILMGPDDSSSEAVNRAKSYFLVNAMVSNSLTFALGPRLLNGQNEDSPSSSSSDNEGEPDSDDEGDAEDQNGNTDDNDLAAADEQTSLMPDIVQRHGRRAHRKARRHGRRALANMPPWVQSTLDFVYQFINAPLIGAIIGGIIGLVPPLHTLFFANPFEGGYFKAWLTSAVQNVGDLFAALQVIVVGVKLAQSLRSMKAGEESGDLPWGAFGLITLARYILWPLISIPIIWLFATRTTLLGSDPVLWFTLMLMPAGPPAMKLTALADVNGTDEKGKMSIAKFLTASYTISPLIAFSVVASLKAAEAAMKK